VIKLKILNWEEYNPKRDQKTYTWLRLQNDVATDKKLFALTAEQKWVWVCLLCEASKANHGELEFDLAWLVEITKVKRSIIEVLLAELEKRGIISLSLPPATADLSQTTPTYERTNVRTNETYERTEDSVAVKITAQPAAIAPQLEGEFTEKASELLKTVPIPAQEAWLAAYGDAAWIRTEINKAAAWIVTNPKKAPRLFPRFMNDWLSRGWEQYRKTLKSNPSQGEEPEWKKRARLDEERKARGA
jgi:hypothetical protein